MSSNSKEENQEKSLLEIFKDFLKKHWDKILSSCLGILFAIFFIDTKDIKNKFTAIVILILLSFLLYRFSNFTIYHVSNHHININLIDSFIFLLLIRTVFYSFNSNKIKQYFLHKNTTKYILKIFLYYH